MLNIDDFILTNCIYISLLSNAFVLIHEYYTNDLLAIQGYNKNSNGKCRWLDNYLNRQEAIDLCSDICIIRWFGNRVLPELEPQQVI